MTSEITKTDFYQQLVDQFTGTLDATNYVVMRQAEGLSHDDSLAQLPFRGNCMNWVLGHIVNARGKMLKLLGEESPFSKAESAIYDTGSETMTNGDRALPFERLLDDLNTTAERIKAAVEQTSQETMLEVENPDQGNSRLDRLLGLTWHETYHSGQFEYLRQATGKDDRVF